MIKRWPTIPFARLLGYSLMLVAPTVLALDGLVFLNDIVIDHALWVVACAMVSGIAVVWLVLGEVSGMSRFTRQIAAGEQDSLPELNTQATRRIARQVAQIDGTWRRRVNAFSRSIDADMKILEALTDPLILVNAEGCVIRANASARRLFERPLADEPIEAALHPAELLESVRIVLDKSVSTTLEFAWGQPPLRHFEAKIMPVETSGRDEIHVTDTPPQIAVVITLHETTLTHRAAEQRETFIANASHELRTPLTVISGFVDTLIGLGEEDRASQRRFLGIIQDQTARMTKLVADLLTLSRIKKELPAMTAVDLGNVASQIIQAMELTAAARSITIEAKLEDDLTVSGNRDQLCQVVQNLLANALKYASESGTVIVAGQRGDGAIALSVRDDGEGIAAEHIPHLGERFYRVDSARSRDKGGSGLGLAIVSDIARLHGGALIIESTPGMGSLFTIRLPAPGVPPI